MHMQGEPRTMQESPQYLDVVSDVIDFLLRERQACLHAGVAAAAIAFDPGIGFGKSLDHNLSLLKQLARIAALEAPLLIGVSRKSIIGRILGKAVDERLYGGLGLAAQAVINGARIIRTHDVGPTLDAIRSVTVVLQGIEH
jgi:dihydropteroate synthase